MPIAPPSCLQPLINASRDLRTDGGTVMKTAPVSGHHPALATLHWLLAVVIIAMGSGDPLPAGLLG
jgi:hypothetical protein